MRNWCCLCEACCVSPALVLVSVYSEEMPASYLKHTSSESLCDTIDWPKLSYPHSGDLQVLISNYKYKCRSEVETVFHIVVGVESHQVYLTPYLEVRINISFV